jgi:hypothetical protein
LHHVGWAAPQPILASKQALLFEKRSKNFFSFNLMLQWLCALAASGRDKSPGTWE